MSLTGKLEHLGVADVVQFIHMGGRTGSLTLHQGSESGTICFHRGRIVSANAPGMTPLGEILLHRGDLERDELIAALESQRTVVPRKPLGKVLLELEAVTLESLKEAVIDQVHEAVRCLVCWQKGNFEFIGEEIQPIDDLELFPGEVLPNLNLDSQLVLLEALRVLDECKESPPEDDQESSVPDPLDVWIGKRPSTKKKQREAPTPRLQLVCKDAKLLHGLRRRLPELSERIVPVELREAGVSVPGDPPPVVIVDLRTNSRTKREDVASLAVRRPRASLLCIVDDWTAADAVYRAGALAVLPSEIGAVAACASNVIRNRGDLWAPQVVADQVRAGYAKLRRVHTDLRSGLLSTTLALNLMSILSESVERAILFLVRSESLFALGGFGDGPEGPLAKAVHGMSLPMRDCGTLSDCLENGSSRIMSYEEVVLPVRVQAVLGQPRSGQCAFFPVLGAKRMIAVIYADNGARGGPLEDVDVLELATAQLGVAFENELLRRQIASLSRSNATVASRVEPSGRGDDGSTRAAAIRGEGETDVSSGR